MIKKRKLIEENKELKNKILDLKLLVAWMDLTMTILDVAAHKENSDDVSEVNADSIMELWKSFAKAAKDI